MTELLLPGMPCGEAREPLFSVGRRQCSVATPSCCRSRAHPSRRVAGPASRRRACARTRGCWRISAKCGAWVFERSAKLARGASGTPRSPTSPCGMATFAGAQMRNLVDSKRIWCARRNCRENGPAVRSSTVRAVVRPTQTARIASSSGRDRRWAGPESNGGALMRPHCGRSMRRIWALKEVLCIQGASDQRFATRPGCPRL